MGRGVRVTTSLAITPETKVADLLEAYPELEEVLISTAPMFAKLRNPVLRRTIAKVTTLERAAAVAGISPRELVGRLREAAGFAVEDHGSESSGADAIADSDDLPTWVDLERVQWTLDADELLEAGDQPIAETQKRAKVLRAGDWGLVVSSFRPAPLIDFLEREGYRTACTRSELGLATYIGLAALGDL